MRKLFLSLAVFVMALCANAQTNQYFWYQGNLMMGNPIAQIDSVTFGEGEPADTLHILLPRTIIKTVYDTIYITIHDTVCPNDIPEGALAGEFSVSATKKVRFSKGNLQFNAAQGTHQCADGTTQQGTWRFSENQYDTIGIVQQNRSASYSGWIDAFAWGTSGWNSGANLYRPWELSNRYYDFYVGGSPNNNLIGNYKNADKKIKVCEGLKELTNSIETKKETDIISGIKKIVEAGEKVDVYYKLNGPVKRNRILIAENQDEEIKDTIESVEFELYKPSKNGFEGKLIQKKYQKYRLLNVYHNLYINCLF